MPPAPGLPAASVVGLPWNVALMVYVPGVG